MPAALVQPLLAIQRPARRMAGAAVRHGLHHVGAPIPGGAPGGVGAHRVIAQVQPVPGHQQPAHAVRPAHLGARVGLADRLDLGAQVGVERRHVVTRHARIGRVRHGRIETLAVARHATAHGAVEVIERILAEARGGVGRDVGRIDRAGAGAQRQAAGHGRPALPGMAGGAVGDARQVAAARDLLRGRRARRRRCPRGQRRQYGHHGQGRKHGEGGRQPPSETSHGAHPVIGLHGDGLDPTSCGLSPKRNRISRMTFYRIRFAPIPKA
ncbi:hypothetical protein D3C86_1300940 [compost metagenome]